MQKGRKMLELFLAAFIFLGIPLLTLAYMAFVKSKEGPDPLEDIQNWGSHDVDSRKKD
jgi:hypothetical protein